MMPYLFQIAGLLILPLWFIVSLWRAKEADRCRWLLKALYSGVFLAYVFVLGRWDFSSVYLPYVLACLYLGAVAKSYHAAKSSPFLARDATPKWSAYGVPIALLAFFCAFLAWGLRGYIYDDAAVELQLPLRDGWFYVGQGGNSVSLNHHNRSKSQRYALDIVALNQFGARASGLYPTELTRYSIFGQPVYSPCNGRVEEAVDDLPEQIPPNSDTRNVAGNHVVVSCKGVLVLLAHLQSGSVQVRKGEALSAGARIGAVGNSGNTSEPHLHVHAVREGSGDVLKGEGEPLVFDGMFPVRNSRFRYR